MMWELYYDEASNRHPVHPEDHFFLAWAVAEYAEESFEKHIIEALGNRTPLLEWRLLDRERTEPDSNKSDPRQQLVDRVEQAAYGIGRAAFSGRIKLACRAKSGGPLQEVPCEHWGIDDFWNRMAASAYNPADPYNVDAEPTHWLFVAEDGWDHLIDDLLRVRGKPLKYHWKNDPHSDSKAEPRASQHGRLNFLPAGDIGRPVELEQAVCLALYGKPSADTDLFIHDGTGEMVVRMPWRDQAEAQQAVQLGVVGRSMLLKALQGAFLTAYVQNPQTGIHYSIPRLYWLKCDLLGDDPNLLQVEDANGLDPSMVGQPIVVSTGELEQWKEHGRKAIDYVSRLGEAENPASAEDRDNSDDRDNRPLPAPIRGKPLGSSTYSADAGLVLQIIELCDNKVYRGPTRLRHAIRSLLSAIPPEYAEDESKIRRIREQVLRARPDLRETDI